MAPQFPSIQTFFPLKTSPSRSSSPAKSCPALSSSPCLESKAGDGFDSSDVEAVLHPSSEDWIPAKEYEEADIGTLQPGPQCVTLVGRLVNFYDQPTPSKMPQAAKGCVKIIMKDDTGAITVSLSLHACKLPHHQMLHARQPCRNTKPLLSLPTGSAVVRRYNVQPAYRSPH